MSLFTSQYPTVHAVDAPIASTQRRLAAEKVTLAELLRGRGYVTPFDVKSIGLDVLRHRVLLSYEAEADGVTVDQLTDRLLDRVPVP